MDSIEKLTFVVSIILALSLASEKLVEIVKNIFPALSVAKNDLKYEGWRQATLHMLSVAAGILTAWLAQDYLPSEVLLDIKPGDIVNWSVIGLGLLASGGSSFWNSILTYLARVKDIKSAEAKEAKLTAGMLVGNSTQLAVGGNTFGFPIPEFDADIFKEVLNNSLRKDKDPEETIWEIEDFRVHGNMFEVIAKKKSHGKNTMTKDQLKEFIASMSRGKFSKDKINLTLK